MHPRSSNQNVDWLVNPNRISLPPRRAGLLRRQRLLQLLRDWREVRLFLIVAPAGYGKTSTLVDWAHQLDSPVSWYSVSSGDRDSHRFYAQFIAAIRQSLPSFGAAASTALRELAAGRGSLNGLITTVVQELNSCAAHHFALVLDDYHLVDEDEEIAAFLSQFLQAADDVCHVILASRTLLSLPDLELLVARGQVNGLGQDELAFRPEEIQSWALQAYRHHLSKVQAEELAQASEGWITGLTLSAEVAGWRFPDRERLLRASGVDVYSYLAGQVLAKQPPLIQEFLLRSSLFEELDPDLCRAVLEPLWGEPPRGWHALLNYIRRQQLFVMESAGRHGQLRYHALFREYLQRILLGERPHEARSLLMRLADAYVLRQQWEQAYELHRRFGDASVMAAFLDRHGLHMLHAGRILLVVRWINELPAAFLQERPILLSLKAYGVVLQGDIEQGLRLLDEAESALAPQGDCLGLALTLANRAVANRLLGRYDASLSDAVRAQSLLMALDEDEPGVAGILALALRSQGLALCMMGRLADGVLWLEQAQAAYVRLGDRQNLALVSLDIGTEYLRTNRHPQALGLFEAALAEWRDLSNLAGQANVLNNIGCLYHLSGQFGAAVNAFAEALDCARKSGYTRTELAALISLGDLFVDLALLDLADEFYGQAYVLVQRIEEGFLRLYLELARAVLAWSIGDWPHAYTCLSVVGELVAQRHSSYEQGLYKLTMGRCYLAQGQPAQAVGPLRETLEQFRSGGQTAEALLSQLYLAAALAAADSPEAEAQLTEVLHSAGGLPNRTSLIVALHHLKGEVGDLLRSPAISQLASGLLAELRAFDAELPTTRRRVRERLAELLDLPQIAQPRIVVRALGSVDVLVRGRVVAGRDWKTRATRDLYFCLLAHPEGLTKEQIGVSLWPDVSPDQLRTRFKNSVYRLRSALGQDVVTLANDRYAINADVKQEYDVAVFLHKLSDAKLAQSSAERREALSSAVQIYCGVYLPDVDLSWALIERERLRRLFLDAALLLAEMRLDEGSYSDALDVARRTLVEDPCLEEAHRLIMRVHAAEGNRGAVAQQFAQCERVLKEEVDAPPSEQTVELYHRLMQ